METKFKKGDKVDCLMYGEGVVTSISTDEGTNFPLRVRRSCSEQELSYTLDGLYKSEVNRTLYLKSEEPRLVFNQEALPIPRVIEVEDVQGNWLRRVAVAFLPEGVVCYSTAKTLGGVRDTKVLRLWSNWREKIVHELTTQEIEEKLGLPKGSLIVKQ